MKRRVFGLTKFRDRRAKRARENERDKDECTLTADMTVDGIDYGIIQHIMSFMKVNVMENRDDEKWHKISTWYGKKNGTIFICFAPSIVPFQYNRVVLNLMSGYLTRDHIVRIYSPSDMRTLLGGGINTFLPPDKGVWIYDFGMINDGLSYITFMGNVTLFKQKNVKLTFNTSNIGILVNFPNTFDIDKMDITFLCSNSYMACPNLKVGKFSINGLKHVKKIELQDSWISYTESSLRVDDGTDMHFKTALQLFEQMTNVREIEIFNSVLYSSMKCNSKAHDPESYRMMLLNRYTCIFSSDNYKQLEHLRIVKITKTDMDLPLLVKSVSSNHHVKYILVSKLLLNESKYKEEVLHNSIASNCRARLRIEG